MEINNNKKRKYIEINESTNNISQAKQYKINYKNNCGICSYEMIDYSTSLFTKYKCINCGNINIKLS